MLTEIFGDRFPAPPAIVLVSAAVALVVVLWDALWRPARNVVTIVHEAGHAVVALVAGRRLSSIRLHSDTSGVTVSRGRTEGPGMVCTALAGYLAPSVLGLAFAGLLLGERVRTLLIICALLLTGVLVMVRNVYGVLSLLVTGGVLVAVSWLATDEVQAGFAYLITWFLLVGGVRPVFELQRKRRRGRARDSDADQLHRLTGAPGLFWVGVFAAVNLGALVLASAWLLLP